SDATGCIPERVQQRYQYIPEDEARADMEPAAASGVEEHSAQDARPEPVADRGQDAAQQFRLDQIGQRQALDREQRVEGVAGALEGGEAEADRGSQYDAVAREVGSQTARDEPERSQLAALLDQADGDVGLQGLVAKQRRLQEGGAQHTQNAAVNEAD